MMSRHAFTLSALLLSAPALAQTSAGNSTSASQSGAQVIQNSSVPSHQTIRTTGSAIAPSLTAAGVNSCAGSVGGALGGTGFGLSFGSTYEMQECNRRAYAATLAGMGQSLAALDLVCQNVEVRAALNNTGVVCPSQRVAASAGAAAAYKATYIDEFFYDRKGRKFRAARPGTHGAVRSASGEWVTLVR